MATLADQILLSIDVYESASLIPSGWQRIAQASDGSSGFFGAAYEKDGEIVIAFRGWNDGNPNDAINVLAAYGNRPFEQMEDAQDFVDAVRAANPGVPVTFTGHSLGGALAGVMAVREGATAGTFGAIEAVDAAFKSMNGYAETFLGITLWDIAAAHANTGTSRSGIAGFAGVVNHVTFGDIAAYNDRSGPGDFIGIDDVLGTSFQNGILVDDSRFGRWLGLTGEVWEGLVPVAVDGAPYSEEFSSQIHSIGFTALSLLFPAQMASLTSALPRLVLQLTNDWLALGPGDAIPDRITYDATDKMVLDHLIAAPGAPTVLGTLLDDLAEIANAGAAGVARSDADIDTAILQLAIQHAARETLDGGATPDTGGTVADFGAYLSASLDGGPGPELEGARVARDYAAWLLRDAASRSLNWIDRATTLIVEANNGATATIGGTGGGDIVFGGKGPDTIDGLGGNDVVFGFDGNDRIDGGTATDVLSGGNGNDTLIGGTGHDVLIGGAGIDTLTGGLHRDFFVFDRLPNASGGDIVADYSVADDTIALDNAIFTALGFAGPLAPAAFRAGLAAGDASDRVVHDRAGGRLLYDSDGTGVAAAKEFASLTPGLFLTALDFIVI